MDEFNLVVIGAGSSGRQAALKAGLFGHTVALVDGHCASGRCEESAATRLKKIMQRMMLLWESSSFFDTDFKQFYEHAREIFFTEEDTTQDQLHFNEQIVRMRNIEFINGKARFLNLDQIEVDLGKQKRTLEGHKILIATGAIPCINPKFPEKHPLIYSTSTIFEVDELPTSMVVYGTHFRALEFAVVLAFCGVQVSLVLPNTQFINSTLDDDIVEAIENNLESLGIVCYKNQDIASIDDGYSEALPLLVLLSNEKQIECAGLLDISYYRGSSESLEVNTAGVTVDALGFIKVNQQFCSEVPHIYAMGESIQAPMLGTDSMDQGRRAVSYMFGLKDVEQLSESWPLQVQLNSPVAVFGETERSLKAREIKYTVGVSHFSVSSKAQFLRIQTGFLKILVRRDTEEIVGVKIVGKNARELIHFGIQLCEDQATLGKVIGSVFNEYTFHELYKFAAIDALYKLRGRG